MTDLLELAARVEGYLKRRREKRLLKTWGGIQWCPWCQQCAQSGPHHWGFKAWKHDPSLDVLTCSVCEGTSVWLWGMGMHYMGRLDPPPIRDTENPAFIILRARAHGGGE